MYELFCLVTSVSRDKARCIFLFHRFGLRRHVELCWQEASIEAEYPSLSDSAVTALRPFVSTCLYEFACSALTAKYSSCISNIETVLRPALTNIELRLGLVCRRKQSYPSHYLNVLPKCKLVGTAGITAQMAEW